jgi:ABC-2 type transport system permease protein
MNGSIKRIGAILLKELQEFKSNINVLFMYLLPLIIYAIFKGLLSEIPDAWTISFSLVMLVGEVCVFVPSMLIAEEKEKKTLNVLMLSPARPFEIFAGKGLITFLTVMLSAVILSFLAGAEPRHMAVILVGTALATIVCTFLGMIVGLLAQNQMATGMLGLPIMLPFIMLPYLALMGNETIIKISRLIPTYYYFKMINLGMGHEKGLGDMLPYLGALAGGVLISLGLLLLIYRKRGLEA